MVTKAQTKFIQSVRPYVIKSTRRHRRVTGVKRWEQLRDKKTDGREAGSIETPYTRDTGWTSRKRVRV